MKKEMPIEYEQSTHPPASGVAQNIQDTVPIYGVHEKYHLIETYKNCFVRVFAIGDNNYLTAPEDEQLIAMKEWKKILNSMGTNVEAELIIFDHRINMQDFCERVNFKEHGDKNDVFRKEINEIQMQRISEGRGGSQIDKYLAVAVHEKRPVKAAKTFSRMEREFSKTLYRIGSDAKALPILEVLDILYQIYNKSDTHLLQKSRVLDENGKPIEISSFDFEAVRKMGISVKDVICPSSMAIHDDYIRMGNKYSRTLRVAKYASKMSDEFVSNVSDTPFESITAINLKSISARKAEAIVAKNLSFVRDLKAKQIKAGQKAGIYDDSYISPELLDREREGLELRDALRQKDEQLFDTTMTVTIFADSLEKLEEYTASIVTDYKKSSFDLTIMKQQQEEGFNSTLPLCYQQIKETRTLTSSSLAMFIPFSTLELNDPSGINYSCNAISKNPIFYNRMQGINYNGFILGCPGMGKSMASKFECACVYLKTKDVILILDPENEYGDLVEGLGGQVIEITPGGKNKINPMDIVVPDTYDENTNPVNEKVESILQIMECIVKSPFGIDSVQETIIDECVHKLFEPFYVDGKLRKISYEEMPTLTDLRNEFAKRPEPEARQLFYALKLYTGEGSLSVFGHHTNVEITNRLVVFQIRDVGERLKNLSMHIILEHFWNVIVTNRKLGKTTWFYIDEIHILFNNLVSAKRLDGIIRRCRKYGAVFTGISQNTTPILENPLSRDMLQNCNFIQILGQAGPDRESLRAILNLSDANVEHITNSAAGQGLIYTGRNIIPFKGEIPKDKKLYRLLTSNPKERAAFAMEDKKSKVS